MSLRCSVQCEQQMAVLVQVDGLGVIHKGGKKGCMCVCMCKITDRQIKGKLVFVWMPVREKIN